jgi:hypothetical protein
MKAHLRTLLRELPPGSTFRQCESGHMEVLLPGGKPLRNPEGMPVRVPLSPGMNRSILNARTRIRRALRDRAT